VSGTIKLRFYNGDPLECVRQISTPLSFCSLVILLTDIATGEGRR